MASYCSKFNTDGTCSKTKDDCIHLGDEFDKCELDTKDSWKRALEDAGKKLEVKQSKGMSMKR